MFEVSVVIPTHNRQKLLLESVDSVRSQTHPVKQIIVVDDGSTDDTELWCKSQDDIIYLKTPHIGPSGARNLGARIALSEWLAFLDSDDVWCPNHIETLLTVVRKFPRSTWIVSNAVITDPELKPLEGVQGFIRAFPVFKMSERQFVSFFPNDMSLSTWHGNAQRQALLGNWLQPSGLLVHRKFFLSINGFNPSLKRCEDMDLLIRMTLISDATVSLCPTYYWRQGQADSLAADKYALLLKLGALRVLWGSGSYHVRKNPTLLLVWARSSLKHALDLLVSCILRLIKKTEPEVWLQTILLSAAAFLNVFLPILLSRFFSQSDFGEYRTFGLYLASSTALSFTSGFWSLLPFWRARKDRGLVHCAVAFNVTVVLSGLFACIVFFVSPFVGLVDSLQKTILLCSSIFFLIPAFYLEQSLNFAGQGLKAAFIVAATEIGKLGSIIFVSIFLKSNLLVFFIIWLSLLIRLLLLYSSNLGQGLFRAGRLSLGEFVDVLKSASPVCVAAAVIAFAASFDRLYLSKQISVSDFAVISAGCITIPVVGIFEQSVYQRAISKIASALQENRFQDAIDIFRRSLIMVASVTLPITFLVFMFADIVISLFFDDRYLSAGLVLQIFTLQNLSSCLPVDILSRAQGKSREVFLFSIVQLSFVLVSVVLSFRIYGAIGAVSAAVVSNLLSRVIFLVWKFRDGGPFKH